MEGKIREGEGKGRTEKGGNEKNERKAYARTQS